jgi:hypothetical protein
LGGPPADDSFAWRDPASHPGRELLWIVVALVLITVLYVALSQEGTPRPGSAVGHGLGIVGFLLMLATEALYSMRKRLPGFHRGRMSTWLQVHVFTGIVGPYLVLLHSAGKFRGLAGVLTLLTVIVVISGLVGRYLYTIVPRTIEKAEVVRQLEARLSEIERRLQDLGADHLGAAVSEARAPGRIWLVFLGRGLLWRRRWEKFRRVVAGLPPAARGKAGVLEELLAERFRLQVKVASLALTRRLVALWHLFHVPLGLAMFTLAFIHVGAALYYSTLLK